MLPALLASSGADNAQDNTQNNAPTAGRSCDRL
jgi:hypothetical protein